MTVRPGARPSRRPATARSSNAAWQPNGPNRPPRTIEELLTCNPKVEGSGEATSHHR